MKAKCRMLRALSTCGTVLVAVTSAAHAQTPDADFQNRCAAAGVIKCVGFDAAADIQGTWGDNHGVLPGNNSPNLDASIKASGSSSLRFTFLTNSGAGAAGSYFTNFSEDLSVQFGENQVFYVQWRQRFTPEFIDIDFRQSGGGGNTGWKQDIIGTGDTPGCENSGSSPNPCATSCTALEVVNVNSYMRGFAHMYNSCDGSTSHGPYDPFEQPFGSSGADFKLQNARPSPYCLYSQGRTSPVTYFPPQGNCLAYFPNEWMTFQVSIQTGPRVNDEFANSYVRLWIAREGQPSQPVFNWGPYNLTAGDPANNWKYGKIWLLPYMTNKDSTQAHPTVHTWYDELIISRNPIADPGTAVVTVPATPLNLKAQ